MSRPKNNTKAKLEIADKVSAVMSSLQRLRRTGQNHAIVLTDMDINKMKVTLEREVQATIDAIQWENGLLTNKIKPEPFKF